MKLSEVLATQRKSAIYAEVFLVILLIGWVDWVTGREISLFAFYSIPIYLAVWYGDRHAGIMVAFLCTLSWWWANKDVHTFTTSYGYPIATVSRLVFFNFFAIGAAALKAKHNADKARIAALERARKLEREIVGVSEREQRRIGQDLHDGLCQTLAAIGCAASSLKDDLQPISSSHAADAQEIAKLLNDAVIEARNLARGISPVDMDEHGLAAALDDLAERTRRLTPLPVIFKSQGEIGLVEPEAAIHLYRIAQEAVHNAVRHSGAEHLTIALRQDGPNLTLSVTDDGKGFAKKNPVNGGMGMQTMSYRAQIIGADLKINGNSPSGCRVACTLKANPSPAPAFSNQFEL
jgi:signal transduction histidine kinase